jgi:putative holliday junction resolvase
VLPAHLFLAKCHRHATKLHCKYKCAGASISLMTNGKFLGIDYGTKRIGVAVSDEDGVLAFPKEIVLNGAGTFKRLGEILKEENIAEIVVGESVDFSGALNALSARIDVFISELGEKFDLPIHKQKEFLTSVEARKAPNGKSKLSPSQAHSKVKQIKSGRIDASAAALILQRYLDKHNSKRS